jgi:hypothetical protein
MYGIKYDNNANHDVFCNEATGEGKAKSTYPDTAIFFGNPGGIIKSHSYYYRILSSSIPIENMVENLPHDTLSIYYFHPDTIDKYSWEEIQREYKVLQRYDLSVEDIILLSKKNNDPEISFPPTEIMKYMRMYPPYGTYNK